jgi:hypothetical protein
LEGPDDTFGEGVFVGIREKSVFSVADHLGGRRSPQEYRGRRKSGRLADD